MTSNEPNIPEQLNQSSFFFFGGGGGHAVTHQNQRVTNKWTAYTAR